MERPRAPCMPTNRLSIGLSAISVERDGSYFISKEEKEGLFCEKLVFKKNPSPSPLKRKVPVNRGLRAVLAGAKGSRRFTSLSQIWCETFVKRQKQEKGLESPVDRGL